MCAVSMITDYGRQNPPWQDTLQHHLQHHPLLGPVPSPKQLPDRDAAEAIKKFLELVEHAKAYDAATKQPNCEDPEKVKFLDEVFKRLDAIEKRLNMQAAAP